MTTPASSGHCGHPRAGVEVLGFLRQAVTDLGQTVVMVTHDPTAASYTDRVDGQVVDETAHPTAERVLERTKDLDTAFVGEDRAGALARGGVEGM